MYEKFFNKRALIKDILALCKNYNLKEFLNIKIPEIIINIKTKGVELNECYLIQHGINIFVIGVQISFINSCNQKGEWDMFPLYKQKLN